jgi:predicted membrane-bound spermidine synthase
MTTQRLPQQFRGIIFLLFFASGFCGLLYQVVWTRMAFASFGIIAPVLSVVLSVFMLGLSLGSWLAGKWVERWVIRTRLPAIFFYGAIELVIGLGAFAVPALFRLGRGILFGAGEAGSGAYLLFSALALAVAILPWCVLMGATFPLMMAWFRRSQDGGSQSFSFLYLANVLGAVAGTLLTALVLIECLGFRHTLWVAAACNFAIAAVSFLLGARSKAAQSTPEMAGERSGAKVSKSGSKGTTDEPTGAAAVPNSSFTHWLLLSTGFIAMAMEVVWTRAFAPVIKTEIYSFALIVATYLAATFVGSLIYRRDLARKSALPITDLVAVLCPAAFLPVIVNDPRLVQADWQWTADLVSVIMLLASICPFCAILGYLTPGLVDSYSKGSAALAGRAYALNVLGCILGPLFASYLLLPHAGDRTAMILLGLPPLAFFGLIATGKLTPGKELDRSENVAGNAINQRESAQRRLRLMFGLAGFVALLIATLFSMSFEDKLKKADGGTVVHRDYAASVISFGHDRYKHLLVNGIGMTSLTPITKFMVHLPLAFNSNSPQSALIICFGMGTTFRSALSWGIDVTAVELVPSVKKAFSYYHTDAAEYAANPRGHVIIDDGRRFLNRTRSKYDVIVIDPPPPPQAAGSSLLYSTEFYEAAKPHLKPGGILQAWAPEDDIHIIRAMARSVSESFPYVRCFRSVEDWGYHFLASESPIPDRTVEQMISRMPKAAEADLLEWSAGRPLPKYLGKVITAEIPIDRLLSPEPLIRVTDDKPFNEYFLMRQAKLLRPSETRPATGASSR